MLRSRNSSGFVQRSYHRTWALTAVMAVGLHACGFAPGPAAMNYSLAPATVAATAEHPAIRARIASELNAAFGTPTQPAYAPNPAWTSAGVDLNLPDSEFGAHYPGLAASAELYRRECLHCHGVEGGGDGPSAFGLSPAPRDVRLGIFKYTALKDQSRPRRADIAYTLEQGIAGTSMPNFQRLSAAEREGLVDYVRLLAIRGEVESLLVASWREEDEITSESLEQALSLVWSRWAKAPSKLVVYDGEIPPATVERVARGRALFHDGLKGNCASCHGQSGAGDGPAAWKIGIDGRREPAYVDAWGRPIRPRDLRDGLFHGGGRPIDIFRRIYAGIPGGPMPALGETMKDGEPLLTSDEIWCLVHYVRSLSLRGEAP